MTDTYLTPRVKNLAKDLEVDLDSLTGTGAGGRITKGDVLAAAAPPPPRHQVRNAPRPGATAAAQEVTGETYLVAAHQFAVRVFDGRTVLVDAWSVNPLADALAVIDGSTQIAAAARVSPLPTLFPSGDLPPFTASGIDPSELLDLRWDVRRHAAGLVSFDAVMSIWHDYVRTGARIGGETGPGAGVLRADDAVFADSNDDYVARFLTWRRQALERG